MTARNIVDVLAQLDPQKLAKMREANLKDLERARANLHRLRVEDGMLKQALELKRARRTTPAVQPEGAPADAVSASKGSA